MSVWACKRAARQRAGRVLRLLAVAGLLTLCVAGTARAQDTTRASADTVRASADTTSRDSLAGAPPRPDTVRVNTVRRDTVRADTAQADTSLRRAPPRTLDPEEVLTLDAPRAGRPVGSGLPTLTPALDVTELLARMPGTYRYDLGGVGWPHSVSVRGHAPSQTALTLDGRPFDDLLTGRPRYDLLPLPFLDTLRAQRSGNSPWGTPAAVHTSLRPYDYTRPLTTARYRSGSFQSIGALHTQRRKVRFFGVPAFAEFSGGYFGRGADNRDPPLLPGSDLRTERRLLGRVRYQRPAWALEMSVLHNRRRIGANGGVVVGEEQPAAIAFLPGVRTVLFGRARRRLLRTDLAATLRVRNPLGRRDTSGRRDTLRTQRAAPVTVAPLTASLYRTNQTLRYRNAALRDSLGVDSLAAPPFTPGTFGADSLEAETVRYGLRLASGLDLRNERLGRHALTFEAHAWYDADTGGNALPDDASRARLHVSLHDSTRFGSLGAVFDAGLHAGPRQTYPSAGVRLTHRVARDTLSRVGLRLFAETRLDGQPVSWIADQGLNVLVRPLPAGEAPGGVLSAEAGGQAQAGPFDLRLTAFARRTTDRLDLYATGTAATVQAALARGHFNRAGLTLASRWRARATRGFYVTASATALVSENPGPRLRRIERALPGAHGQARLGARYTLFEGDLALDAYADGRFWTRAAGRTPHGPTGRLVLPLPGGTQLGPAGTIDLHAEAQVRTATLFFSYENALAGTQVQRGVLGAPVYPLAAQRFRFGVYWPIFN